MLESQAGLVGLALVAVVLIAGVAWYGWDRFRKTRHQRHIHKVIESLGVDYRRDIVLPDGVEGLAFIDYLLLVPDGVVVLDVQHVEGHLFGGEAVDQWSQVVNNRTYKFSNPLYANQTKCQTVLWNVEQMRANGTVSDPQHNRRVSDKTLHWDVHGWVAFSNAGNFPKGIPAKVSLIDDLPRDLASLIQGKEVQGTESASISEEDAAITRRIWDQLYDVAVATRAELRD